MAEAFTEMSQQLKRMNDIAERCSLETINNKNT